MLVKIRTTDGFSVESFAEKTKTLLTPALLLDTHLKVLARNGEAVKSFSCVQPGASITRYIDEMTSMRLHGMTLNETCTVDFKYERKLYRANAVCNGESITLVFHEMESNLQKDVYEKYLQMSGYDIDMQSPLPSEAQGLEGYNADRLIMKLVQQQAEPRKPIAFDAESVLAYLQKEITRKSVGTASRIRFSLPPKELLVEGSEKDFAVTVTALLHICINDSVGEVYVASGVRNGEVILRFGSVIGSDPFGAVKLSPEITENDDRKIRINKRDRRLYLLKLLADGNLWELTGTVDEDSRLSFVLRIPLYNGGAEFMVRSVPNELIEAAVELFFGEAERPF